jgi:hypothetical protein
MSVWLSLSDIFSAIATTTLGISLCLAGLTYTSKGKSLEKQILSALEKFNLITVTCFVCGFSFLVIAARTC